LNAEDVRKRLEQGESLTWDDIREITEEDLKGAFLHFIKNDAEYQEAIAGWLAAFYKGVTSFGPVPEGLKAILDITLAKEG